MRRLAPHLLGIGLHGGRGLGGGGGLVAIRRAGGEGTEGKERETTEDQVFHYCDGAQGVPSLGRKTIHL